MSLDDCLAGRCDCHPPPHDPLICSGSVCIPACQNYQWAQRHDLIGKVYQRYQEEETRDDADAGTPAKDAGPGRA